MLALLASESGALELRGRKQQELESKAFWTIVNISWAAASSTLL